jgi:hypothetical protein
MRLSDAARGRRGQGGADPVVSVTHPPPPPLAEEAVHGLCREGNAGCVPAVALAGPLHPVTVPGPAVSTAVALPVRERRDAWHPEAQAQDVAEPFVLHTGVRHGLDDHSRVRARGREDVGSDELLLMFAAPHPPQCAGMQDEVGRQGPVNRSCLGYDAGDCLAFVWVALDVAFSDGFIWYIPQHMPAQGQADYSVVDHLRTAAA